MTTILAFLFVLGVLIFVHELGHFVMARRVGVRVLKFSLGFGPRLVGFTRGDTEYVISAVPLGGFVKMAGENPDDPRSGRDDEFLSKSKWERFQILIMGPLMNLFLAVVVLAGVLMNGAEIPAYQSKPPVVGHVTADTPRPAPAFSEAIASSRWPGVTSIRGSRSSSPSARARAAKPKSECYGTRSNSASE